MPGIDHLTAIAGETGGCPFSRRRRRDESSTGS